VLGFTTETEKSNFKAEISMDKAMRKGRTEKIPSKKLLHSQK